MRQLSLLLGFVTFASQAVAQARSLAGRSVVYAPNGVVAAPQPLAAQAGLSVLQGGGNAIDAAVTTAVMLALVEPFMSGLGGDLFVILWSAKEQRLVGLNASGRAGSLAKPEVFRQRGLARIPTRGAETITVPGALSGWVALLEKYGTITLARALEPTIALAESGFPVSPIIAKEWAVFAETLRPDSGGRATFFTEGSRTPKEGEWFRNPDFAATLRTIAREGPTSFYGGPVGRRVAEGIQRLGGFITADDLAAHRVEWVEPMGVPFRGYTLWELPPNGQGIAALEMARILEPFDLEAMGHNSAKYLHHVIEAKKLAYADLDRYIGDPATMRIAPAALLSESFIAGRRKLIDPAKASAAIEPGLVSGSETTYLAAADRDGNMISLITSLASGFGSGVVVPGTGFALQNRGVGFSLEPDRPNTLAPGRRPFHTIIPGFVTRTAPNGRTEPWLAFGIVGGAQQPQAHIQMLLNMVVFGMDVQQALDAPRFNHLAGLRVGFEPPIEQSVVSALEAMGHQRLDTRTVLGGLPILFGGGQAIQRLVRGYAAGSDPRRDGAAVAH